MTFILSEMKIYLLANPSLLWVLFLLLIFGGGGVTVYLARLVIILKVGRMKEKEDTQNSNIVAVTKMVERFTDTNERGHTHLSSTLAELDKTLRTVTTEMRSEFQHGIERVTFHINDTTGDLYNKCNANAEKILTVEGVVKGLLATCAACGRTCPHRNTGLLVPGAHQ
jgi:hypothetical protein